MVRFRVETRSGVPPYQQLVGQVRQALRMGILRVGDQLPTVREVVAAVAVNPNTVARAYRELEHEGLVQGRPGVGTFVVALPAGPPPGVQMRLARALRRWVGTARDEGLDDEAIEALVRATLAEAGAGAGAAAGDRAGAGAGAGAGVGAETEGEGVA